MRADVVVVGAGITGLSLSFFLRRGGAEVLVVERSGIAAGASGVQPGGVRQQWSTEVNCRLARESVAFYAHLDDELGSKVDARLDRCGYLFVAIGSEILDRLRSDVELQNSLGVPSRIVDADEAASLVPGLTADAIVGAAWCGEDGYFDRPQTVVDAFARDSQRVIGDVRALRREGNAWMIETADATLEAPVVALATGVDTPALLEPLGVDVPIEPEARHLFLSEPVGDRLVEPLVVVPERSFAAKHLANGRVLASDLSAAGDAESQRETWRATVARGIAEILPSLSYVSFPVIASGLYDVTPDHQPIVGPVPGHDGLWIAAGYSGHGFMLAPAISRRLAEAITAAGDAPIPEFAPTRFSGAPQPSERSVV